MGKFINIVGNRYGKFTVLEYDKEKQKWKCRCDCGNIRYIRTCGLKSGHYNSCGCERYKYEKIKSDERFHRLYCIYDGIKKRCNIKTCKDYKRYGAKGIKMCDEWKDFRNFFNWAINNGYKHIEGRQRDKLSIDRIDSSKGYYPENCRWITLKENSERVPASYEKLKKFCKENDDERLLGFYERKSKEIKEREKRQEEQNKKKQGYFYRKNVYALLYSKDKKYLFKNLKNIALFLNISSSSLYHKEKRYNGVITENWKLERITKEEFDKLKEDVEVIY